MTHQAPFLCELLPTLALVVSALLVHRANMILEAGLHREALITLRAHEVASLFMDDANVRA